MPSPAHVEGPMSKPSNSPGWSSSAPTVPESVTNRSGVPGYVVRQRREWHVVSVTFNTKAPFVFSKGLL